MHDYDVFSMQSKAEVLEKSREYWNPGKTDFWAETGVDLVIDRRESYFIWDMSGLRLIDVHLNGGTYTSATATPSLSRPLPPGWNPSTSATTTSRPAPGRRSPRR